MAQAETRWFTRFFAIWTGQAFSLIGSQLVQFSLVWYITIQTGSATVLAVASIAALLPQIVLSPIAGAYVDRWKRRHVMIGADALIAGTTVVLIVLFALGIAEIWEIIVVMLVRSCFSAFHWPASQAATTVLVPEEQLTRVAGMNQSLQGLAGILAPPLGAVLIAILPMEQVLLVDVVTAAVAILPLLYYKFAEPAARTGPPTKVTADMKEAMRFIKGWHGALTLLLIFTIANMLLGPAFSLMPILVLDHFHGGPLDYASAEAMAGIGMIVGGVALSIWGGTKRRIVTTMASTALAGVGTALIAFVPSSGFVLVLGLMLFIGLMMPLLNGSVMALMQACVPKTMQGRVFALVSAVVLSATPIGLAIAGPVADLVGILPWFLIAGAVIAVMGAVSFLIPSIMLIEDPEARPYVAETLIEEPSLAAETKETE